MWNWHPFTLSDGCYIVLAFAAGLYAGHWYYALWIRDLEDIRDALQDELFARRPRLPDGEPLDANGDPVWYSTTHPYAEGE